MDIFDIIAYNARETIGRFQLVLNKCNVDKVLRARNTKDTEPDENVITASIIYARKNDI